MSAEKARGAEGGRTAEVLIGGRTFAQAMQDFEAQYLVACLEAANLNRRKAAARAGLKYDTFRRRLAGLGIKTVLTIQEEEAA